MARPHRIVPGPGPLLAGQAVELLPQEQMLPGPDAEPEDGSEGSGNLISGYRRRPAAIRAAYQCSGDHEQSKLCP
jgi:hypothetical protein